MCLFGSVNTTLKCNGIFHESKHGFPKSSYITIESWEQLMSHFNVIISEWFECYPCEFIYIKLSSAMREKTVPEPLVNHQCAQIFQINETLIKPINSLFPIKTAHCQVVRFCWSHMKHNIIILNWTIELIQSVVIFPDSCFFLEKWRTYLILRYLESYHMNYARLFVFIFTVCIYPDYSAILNQIY